MRAGLLKSLLAIAAMPAKRCLQSPRFMARLYTQTQVPTFTLIPPTRFHPSALATPEMLFDANDDCGKTRYHKTQKCPKRRRTKPPCRKPIRCPPFKPHWDRCDPWGGTRRSKKAKYFRKVGSKKSGKKYVPKEYCD